MPQYAKIIGTGSYLPKRVLTNNDLSKMVDTTNEWIVKRTGISSRHIIADDETVSTMAFNAATQALDIAGIQPNQLGLVIMATATPDKAFPSSACLLQNLLGISDCPAFDMTAACSGFIYALSVADQYIKSGVIKYALVVGSEAISRVVDWTDRSTCILFGDGAGAVVLGASNVPGIILTDLHASGSQHDLLYASNGYGESQVDQAVLKMKGREVFKVAVKKLTDSVENALINSDILKAEIDWLIPHQANIRIIEATARKLNLPMSKVILTLKTHGNTSAASIPLALDVGVRDGKIKPGELLLLDAFGAGFTWATAVLRY